MDLPLGARWRRSGKGAVAGCGLADLGRGGGGATREPRTDLGRALSGERLAGHCAIGQREAGSGVSCDCECDRDSPQN
jgi:hypothetical protein